MSTSQNTDSSSFFESQRQASEYKAALARKKVNRLAGLRLTLFVLIAGGIYWISLPGNAGWWWIIVVAAGFFLRLMSLQQKAKRALRFQLNLYAINTEELERLNLRFSHDDTGMQFFDSTHAYAGDLDVFGKHSLYRLLNRTGTAEGASKLAHWLLNAAGMDEISLRQELLLEMKAKPEWMQDWQATARLHEFSAQNIDALYNWAGAELNPALRKILPVRWLTLATLTLGILSATTAFPAWVFWALLLIHGVIIYRFQPYLKDITEQTYRIGHTLLAYSDLLKLMDKGAFRGRLWKQLTDEWKQEPARELAGLGTQFNRLDFRNNVYFFLVVGLPGLWDLHCVYALEKWRKKNSSHLRDWIVAMGETEAMVSLAGFAFAHPEYSLPEIVWDEGVRIESTSLGHPLIGKEKRVENSFSMEGIGKTILITGSNMSGKSTFLRTIGVNLVLAQMGSVCAADRFLCSRMKVFSSMRIQDSLEESTSSFYAELKRIRQLIQLVKKEEEVPVFYLLDEILKGTNSQDRHRGAEAIIRQLHPANASGMVSTHDLELGDWGDTQDYIFNYHFRSDVVDGKLTFDYRLHTGICESFNARELMQMMGIDLA